ncbi:hypothetical protein PUN28_003930 [Cardiocondyla obscurior]|uniref:Uncharacterized protein n=1 Tax=Cardiocondyla obscurior TaxID=286306 RepID=A0AAW2GLI4_9HYME
MRFNLENVLLPNPGICYSLSYLFTDFENNILQYLSRFHIPLHTLINLTVILSPIYTFFLNEHVCLFYNIRSQIFLSPIRERNICIEYLSQNMSIMTHIPTAHYYIRKHCPHMFAITPHRVRESTILMKLLT